MTVATSIATSKLSTYTNPTIVSSSITLVSSSFVGSQGIASVVNVSLKSYGWYSQTNSMNFLDNSSMFSSSLGIITASWSGSSDTFGAIDTQLSSSLTTASFETIATSWGSFYEIPETRNSNPITSDNVNSDQSSILVDWNFFPIPSTPTVIQTTSRDATRYQKAYSFSRNQPVRIRVFRQ